MTPASDRLWWEHDHLTWQQDKAGETLLTLGGRPLQEIALRHGTPCYVYSGARIAQKAYRIREAAAAITPQHKIFYAMKANRNPHVLSHMRELGLGIDTCSGSELRLALEAGFSPEHISFTSVSLTDADLALLARVPQVQLNVDSLSQMHKVALASPRRAIGIRINPRAGFGYTDSLEYGSATRVTKFGIYRDAFEQALDTARELGLTVNGLHCHSGWGLQQRGLPGVERVLTNLREFCSVSREKDISLQFLNLGGGLGTPLCAEDQPVKLEDWVQIVRKALGPELNKGLTLCLEPGDFLVRDSGVLISKVLAVEEKCGTNFAVVDASFAVNLQQAAYSLPMNAVIVRGHAATSQTVPGFGYGPGTTQAHVRYTLAGSINEAVDILGHGICLPELREGTLLAFTATGAYGSSMSSQHCLRGQFTEVFVP